VTKKQMQGNNLDQDIPELSKRNAKFDQESADSRDHDKQSGKGSHQKKSVTPVKEKTGKSKAAS